MKVRCNGLDLSEGILAISKAIPSKTTSPILEGIKIVAEDNALILSATDLELYIEKKIRAEVIVEGEAVIPGRLFVEYVKHLTGEEIELTLNEGTLKINYQENTGTIVCLNSLEFPNMKKIESSEYIEIKQNNLKTLINKSIISVSLDDSRPILKGILVEIEDNNVTAVALDGFRLAVINKSIEKTTARLSAVIPARSMFEIAKLLDDSDDTVKIYIQKNYMMVELNNTTILTRLLDGDYVNYKRIIPANQRTHITVQKEMLETALERASLLARTDRSNIVKIEINGEFLLIKGNSEIGEIFEKVNIANETNSELVITFNAKYLIDVLKNQNDEFISISFESKNDPCVITNTTDNEYLYLIMPTRLPE